MSDSDRNGNIALVISAVAVFLLIVGGVTGLILSEYANVHKVFATYQENAERDRDAATDEIGKSCYQPDIAVFSKCLKEKVTAYYTQQATNQDLQAQKDMAFWAATLFALGIVQLAFSGAGIYFIWQSLALNRDAVAEATKANANTIRAIGQEQTNADRQQRAYIGVESIMLDCPSVNIPNYKPVPMSAGATITDFVVLNIQNFGATPANKVYTWVNWFVVPYPQSLPLNFNYPDVATPLPPDIEISMIETNLFPSQKFASRVAMSDVNPVILSNARQAFVYFYGKIVYTDITKTERFTYFCFRHIAGRQPGQEFERYRDHNYAT
jgi:hypothetical protein